MKIRVEFDCKTEGDGESDFDVVELSTAYADSYEDWGGAVRDFVATAGKRWDRIRVIQEALLLDGGYQVDWNSFVEMLSEECKDKLRFALEKNL